jgi:hypothetical protein
MSNTWGRIGSRSALACMVLAASAVPAFGDVFGFAPVTANTVANTGAGMAQLTMSVDPAPAGRVSFTFMNAGPLLCSITDVYFDDSDLVASLFSITNMTGVSFSQGAAPPNLPGGNMLSPAFSTSTGLSADSNPPAQPNGVNPGEQLSLTMTLNPGKTFGDVIAALNVGGSALRVGIHVQGFADGGSESFINQVPAPGAAALLGLGALAVGRRRR